MVASIQTLWRTALASLWLVPTALALLAVGAAPSLAQEERVTVRLDGRALFRVSAAEGLEADARARRVERRLVALLERPQAIAPARVERSDTERIVTVTGAPVVRVTETDAQENLTTVDALAAQWSAAVDRALVRGASRRQSSAARFAAEVRASVETAFARLLESAITLIPRALAALVVLLVFWATAASVRAVLRAVFRRVVSDTTLENLLKQVAYYAVWALGIAVAVDALGIDPQAAATGLGLTGLALGFALKDVISNFVSGLLILLLRPFHLGDQIVVGETEGTLERITLRATEIRTYDGRLVLVPNAELFTSRVTNNTAAPIRRGSVELFLGYDSSLQEAVEVIRTAAQTTTGVLEDPAASVRVRELGQDDLVVEARFWADSRRSDFLATQSAVRAAIVAALREAGIGLPDPDVRHLVFRNQQPCPTTLAEDGRGVRASGRRREAA